MGYPMSNKISLETARYKLATIWFPACGVLFLIMAIQTLMGAYGADASKAWGWALPNFLPTLALMISVFAAGALQPDSPDKMQVRRSFFRLSAWLSIFYIAVLFLVILAPVALTLMGKQAPTVDARISAMEQASIFTGPLQGLVIAAIGVLFFLKDKNDA
jgi:hypothetical protein